MANFVFHLSCLIDETTTYSALAERSAYRLVVWFWAVLYRPLLDRVCFFGRAGSFFMGLTSCNHISARRSCGVSDAGGLTLVSFFC